MAVKTDFSKQQLLEILSSYTLGAYRDSKPIPQGTVQTNYFLRSTQGSFVFRYYENRSRGSVLFETNLMHYLKHKNYPCPAPLRNRQGSFVGMCPVPVFRYWTEFDLDQSCFASTSSFLFSSIFRRARSSLRLFTSSSRMYAAYTSGE